MKKIINYFLLMKLNKKYKNQTQYCEQGRYIIHETIGGSYKVMRMTKRLDRYVTSPSMIVMVKGMKAYVVNYCNEANKPSVYMERSAANAQELDNLLYSLLTEMKTDLKPKKAKVSK